VTGRAAALGVLVLVGIAAIFMARRLVPTPETPRLAWVATAHQFGPVGYRDPAAAISPDGQWVAYSEGRFLRVRAIDGGPGEDFSPAAAQIRHVAWRPDNRTILAGGDLYDRATRTRRAVWSANGELSAGEMADMLRQAVWSPDGGSLAGIVNDRDGAQLWIVPADGSPAKAEVTLVGRRASFPAWTPEGKVACLALVEGRWRVTVPCGKTPIRTTPDLDAYGPIAFAPDAATVYLGMPNTAGMLDLWAVPVAGGSARRLTSFSRDTYAPTVAANGTILFKTQTYRTVVANVPAEGGAILTLAAFQSETPSWDPSGHWLGLTFGNWRRVVDDAHYPDIAQEVGIIAATAELPSSRPARVVHDSSSEDQSMCWSPNGKWIAFHSHKDQSDDIWLRAADGDVPPHRISMLGRGAETGWPRWSPDGRWLLFEAASRRSKRSVLYVIGIDQGNGRVTAEATEIAVSGIDAEIGHGEWLPDSNQIVTEATETPGRHAIFTVPRSGGAARVVYRFASEHEHPGLGVSPDGREVAFIAPDAAGFFQVFRLPIDGGAPRQITTDLSHKTQPAWSPDGRRVAFTVWEYHAQLWTIQPRGGRGK
jgi:Tol biopolymer transport system component